MRLAESDNNNKNTLNLTPLIDLLFILIIFFAVSTQFKEIPALDISLPEAGASTGKPQMSKDLWIRADGGLFFGTDSLPTDSLVTVFQQLMAEDSSGTVVLKADEDAPYGIMIKVMDAAQFTGFQNLILATSAKPKDQ
jgi:biopolymer transport protein ExbD